MKLKEATMSSQRWWDVACEQSFVNAILDTYVSLPQTPNSAEVQDRRFACELYHQGYELYNVEAALLLCSVRRIFTRRLSFEPTMRNLKEFASYIEEFRSKHLELNYVRYLRDLLSPVLCLERESSD
jgi:hypothetical protein